MDPKEKMILAAVVNQLCETDPSQTTSDNIRIWAQQIVTAIDPRIRPSGRVFGLISGPKEDKSDLRMAGASNAGNVQMSFASEPGETKETIIGTQHVYRIGNYVATKRVLKRKGLSSLWLDRYFGYGGANVALETFPPNFSIKYETKGLGLQDVFRHEAVLTRIWGLSIVRYVPVCCMYEKKIEERI